MAAEHWDLLCSSRRSTGAGFLSPIVAASGEFDRAPQTCDDVAVVLSVGAGSAQGQASLALDMAPQGETCGPAGRSGECSESATLTVVKLDFRIPGLPEEEESNPGGLTPANDDDDNDNGVEDRYEGGPIFEEDDLVTLLLTAPPNPAATVRTGESMTVACCVVFR